MAIANATAVTTCCYAVLFQIHETKNNETNAMSRTIGTSYHPLS